MSLFAKNRKEEIKKILFETHSVKVSDLVSLFNVSEETIRRDLKQFENEGLVEKYYGGAILLEEHKLAIESILTIEQRKNQFYKEKDIIGKKASELILSGQNIIIDAGTTTWCIAKHLKKHEDVMIMTNGLIIAEECCQNEKISVYLTGGKIFKKSLCTVGPSTLKELQKFSVDYVFLGVAGITCEKGFTSFDIYEAEIKRAIISVGKKTVIVADHGKFGCNGLVSFGGFEDIDVLITTDLADNTILEQIKNHGVKIIICPIEKGKFK